MSWIKTNHISCLMKTCKWAWSVKLLHLWSRHGCVNLDCEVLLVQQLPLATGKRKGCWNVMLCNTVPVLLDVSEMYLLPWFLALHLKTFFSCLENKDTDTLNPLSHSGNRSDNVSHAHVIYSPEFKTKSSHRKLPAPTFTFWKHGFQVGL